MASTSLPSVDVNSGTMLCMSLIAVQNANGMSELCCYSDLTELFARTQFIMFYGGEAPDPTGFE